MKDLKPWPEEREIIEGGSSNGKSNGTGKPYSKSKSLNSPLWIFLGLVAVLIISILISL